MKNRENVNQDILREKSNRKKLFSPQENKKVLWFLKNPASFGIAGTKNTNG